ncbi:hepatitis A virus cellular receptor 2 [Alexandromys fortis]|uniref:hepatitis A virus cellular receptor 2 n=1 Tax=Alexandromys fortis TaxID=100897 RepID=UPI0021523C44|nr:hepatitis A virus cellular receptor 2 homolog [Microtus fortis]
MFSHLTFNGVLLLLLLLLARSLEDAFIVEVGKNAYLPCNYSITAYGTPVPVCWGKGPCPFSHCGANNVLSTDERNVTCQKSRRYQLKGNFLKGDVSLTIENVTLADGGTYCCRVKFPGLGNDKKVNLELDIRPETQTLGTLQDKSQTQISTWTNEMKDSGETIRTAVHTGVRVFAGLALTFIFGVLFLKSW